MKFLAETFFQHYTSHAMARVYAINAPRAFSWVFSLAKKFLPGELARLVEVHSDASPLLQAFDADVLPTWLGGKRIYDHKAWMAERALAEASVGEHRMHPDVAALLRDTPVKQAVAGPNVVRCGWLKKKAGWLMQRWNRRFCVLHPRQVR